MRTINHLIPLGTLFAISALPAMAAEEGHGEGFMGGLAYAASDPVTFVAFLALVVFLLIAARMGAFKTILGGLDARSIAIATELEEARNLRERAAEALAHAERRQQDADKEAEAMIDQAKADAKQIMAEARKDIADRMVRREALAESRIARAENEATEQVRHAAANAAISAARRILSEDTRVDQFEPAAREIDRALS
jgi:F-type H+-transporting ATPase subunit b